MRRLRSGDVEVMVPNQKLKDQALNQASTEGCKILRQDYPVAIPRVPLSLGVTSAKSVENETIIKEICAATKKIVPLISINRISWLHDDKSQEARRRSGKTTGTIVVSLPNQAVQHEVVRHGLVINAQLYKARLHSKNVDIKQCFNCNQWGHTQSACGKPARCAECAGPHQTKECKKERISCSNCGKPHKAWQKGACQTYAAYYEGVEKKRTELYLQSLMIQNAPMAPSSPPTISQATLASSVSPDGFCVVGSRKRARPLSPPEPRPTLPMKRGVGRPTNIETAARDRSQSRLRVERPTPLGASEAPQANQIQPPQPQWPRSHSRARSSWKGPRTQA